MPVDVPVSTHSPPPQHPPFAKITRLSLRQIESTKRHASAASRNVMRPPTTPAASLASRARSECAPPTSATPTRPCWSTSSADRPCVTTRRPTCRWSTARRSTVRPWTRRTRPGPKSLTRSTRTATFSAPPSSSNRCGRSWRCERRSVRRRTWDSRPSICF